MGRGRRGDPAKKGHGQEKEIKKTEEDAPKSRTHQGVRVKATVEKRKQMVMKPRRVDCGEEKAVRKVTKGVNTRLGRQGKRPAFMSSAEKK